MSRLEKETFKLLKVEEDRRRFKEMFWKARDPSPHTPANEYRATYYQRVRYAKTRLEGANSDRGRIYILLGKPKNISTFSGHQRLVECELWHYISNDDSGLVPFMNLLFFRPKDSGRFHLFHPGIHQSNDLLAPFVENQARSPRDAYRMVAMDSEELAQATLSVIPGEVNPNTSYTMGSSNFVLQKIYSLPERDVKKNYIRNFRLPQGYVSVTSSTKEIRGYVDISISQYSGFTFLNYSFMPENLTTSKLAADKHVGKINLSIRIEDLQGQLIFQNERKYDLTLDKSKLSRIRESKIVFRDFIPIIPGVFNVTVTYLNKSTDDFFTTTKKIDTITTLPCLLGFEIRNLTGNKFTSYAANQRMVLSDPRFLFGREDALEGLVFCQSPPRIMLQKSSSNPQPIEIKSSLKEKGCFHFTHPLKDIKDGNYVLSVTSTDGRTYSQKLHILPPYMKKKRSLALEKSDPPTAIHNYIFVLGQEYYYQGKFSKSIEEYKKLPQKLWNGQTLPIIARAYYGLKNYKKVMQLLDRPEVKKDYAILSMLANSAIEEKELIKAAALLKELQKYQDTAEINRLLAAVSLSLGDQKSAKKYFEKAKNLSEQHPVEKD